ncbi:hypothetical protein Pelo_2426 [Pelomyxa schiedti]|nr:hypothetical protein Pelo_2426 [Pelomyxa schiedti]
MMPVLNTNHYELTQLQRDGSRVRLLASPAPPPPLPQSPSQQQAYSARMVFDWGRGIYYDTETQLHWDPKSGLHANFSCSPPVAYHWNPASGQYAMVLPAAAVVVCNDDFDYGVRRSRIPSTKEECENASDDGDESGPVMELIVHDTTGKLPDQKVSVGNQEGHPCTIKLGRSSSCDVVLRDVEVSKHHASMTYESLFWEYYFRISDVGSRNGTYVNDIKLTYNKSSPAENQLRLYPGDVIHIGKFDITFEHPEKKPDANPTPAESTSNCTSSSHPTYNLGGVQVSSSEWVEVLKKNVKTLTRTELKLTVNRKEKYEDRAAKRRRLYPKETYTQLQARRELGSTEDDGATPAQQQQQQQQPGSYPKRRTLYGEDGSTPPTTDQGAALTSDNKGYRMLSGMGWKEGQGLGADEHGTTAPVLPSMPIGRRGLGF